MTRDDILEAAHTSVAHDIRVASQCRNKYAFKRERLRARRWYKIQERLRAKMPITQEAKLWHAMMMQSLLDTGRSGW